MSLDPPLSAAQLVALAQHRIAGVRPIPPVMHESMLDGHRIVPPSPIAKPPRQRARDLEHPQQVAVIAWADDPATLPHYPELKALYSVPNESKGKLDGARKKASGRRKGMPDLVLPSPRRLNGIVFGALYVEMKDEGGTVRKSQRERITLLRAAGNRVEVALSSDAAIAIITHYLNLPKP